MRINTTKVNKILFYDALFNPIRLLIIVWAIIYILLLSWIGFKTYYENNKRYKEFYWNKKEIKKSLIAFLKFIFLIIVNTFLLNESKTEKMWNKLEYKYIIKEN